MVIQNGRDLIMAFYPRGGTPEKDTATVASYGHEGLRFVMGSLVKDSGLFGDEEFTVIAQRDDREIGRGVYKRLSAMVGETEVVSLEVIAEVGEMTGIMRILWSEMVDGSKVDALEEVAAR